ncbi:hypothetical protein EAE99_003785 [Botrytis elliptica]|nr:hypothetical protein EAE99_003785 [Botrytis elliptica]
MLSYGYWIGGCCNHGHVDCLEQDAVFLFSFYQTPFSGNKIPSAKLAKGLHLLRKERLQVSSEIYTSKEFVVTTPKRSSMGYHNL